MGIKELYSTRRSTLGHYWIQTLEFEGPPERGHVVLDTMRLEELPGNRTRVMIQSVYQSVEDRDGMVQSAWKKASLKTTSDSMILAGMK